MKSINVTSLNLSALFTFCKFSFILGQGKDTSQNAAHTFNIIKHPSDQAIANFIGCNTEYAM